MVDRARCDAVTMHGMSIDAARAFNPTCTLIEVALRDGSTRTGKTKGTAIVWAGYG